MTRPVIGLSCYLEPAEHAPWKDIYVEIHSWYMDIIHQAGGIAMCLPHDPSHDVTRLTRIDGLILAGGVDVDPSTYGRAAHPKTDAPNTERDLAEIALVRAARAMDLPTLGICRGMQVMAAAFGGSLHQHIPEFTELAHKAEDGGFVDHEATFTAESLIARSISATTRIVNSSHHQAVDDPGELVVTGWAADGTIEVIEDPTLTFYLGVQWHPETRDRHQIDADLISALVTASMKRSAQ